MKMYHHREYHSTPLSLRCIASRTMYLLGITLVFLPSNNHQYFATAISVGGFISAAEEDACKHNLDMADTMSPYGLVGADEYAEFLNLWSDGNIAATKFEDLFWIDMTLVGLFQNDIAKEGPGNKLYISTANTTPDEEAILQTICAQIKTTIAQYLPPTSSPTTRPSFPPSTTPSIAPSTTTTTTTTTPPTATTTVPPPTTTTTTTTTIPSPTPSLPDQTSFLQSVQIQISYDLTTDGVDANRIMSGANNNIQNDLISATTSVVSQTLGRRRRRRMSKQTNVQSSSSTTTTGRQHLRRKSNSNKDERNLALYSATAPVTVVRALDIPCSNSSQGGNSNCVIINSLITIFLEQGDNADDVQLEVFNGIKTSFKDGTFKQALSL